MEEFFQVRYVGDLHGILRSFLSISDSERALSDIADTRRRTAPGLHSARNQDDDSKLGEIRRLRLSKIFQVLRVS